ncbi:hypothetical protein EVAR_71135_1 [Eumeta japonica]|uniref:Mos1 transposase HTH domain-containing protein n=1 Tax=Eumeta variegata TaxID=151549 RepID=A0A4C1ZQN7_EUMVA|nr:hypothetical protein EVAR_71135_1 [Eumeta japonica]
MDQITSTFGDETPSKTNAFSEFKRGQFKVKSVDVPKHIVAVRELIMQDRHVTYREIRAYLGLKLMWKLREHDDVGGAQTQQADGQRHVHGDEAPDAQRERPEFDKS